jgi:hypothetical protein
MGAPRSRTCHPCFLLWVSDHDLAPTFPLQICYPCPFVPRASSLHGGFVMHPSEPLFRLRGRRFANFAMFWTFKNGVRQSYDAPSSVSKAASRMHALGLRKRWCSGHSLP